MADIQHQDFDTVQSDKQLTPPTVPSAATLVPTTRLTFVTGIVAVASITPPVTGYHELVFVFTNAVPAALLITGNIQAAYTPIQNQAFSLHYDPSTAKYWREAVT